MKRSAPANSAAQQAAILRTMDITAMRLAARAMPESYDEGKRTVDVIFSTGARVLRWDWTIGWFYEELDMSEGAVRMERISNGKAAVLDSHMSYTLASQIGVVDSARIEGGQGIATIRFSSREQVAGIVQDIRDGIIANVSVGYEIHAMELLEQPDDGAYPVYRVTDWEPYEISMVPIPADAEAGTRSAGKKTNPCQIKNCVRTQPTKGDTNMDEKEKARLAAAQGRAKAEDKQKAADAERQRAAGILTLCRKHGVSDEQMQEYITKGTTLDQVRTAILDGLAGDSEENASRSQIRASVTDGTSDVEKRAAAMSQAILHRIAPGKHKLEGQATEYRGMTMFEMARDYVEKTIGQNTRGWDRGRVVRTAMSHRLESRGAGGTHTTSDFANILSSVVHTQLRAAYAAILTPYDSIVNVMTATDYRPVNQVNVGDAPELLPVNEAGEYEYGSFGDSKETIKVAKYGRIIRVTEEVIINDNLRVFDQLPTMFGERSARLIARLVWEAISKNPTMGDGKALFHADHGNLLTGANSILDPEDITALTEARKLLRNQTWPGTTEKQNRTLATLLLPIALETVGEQLIYPVAPTESGKVNPFARQTSLIVSGELDNVANGDKMWYGIAEGARPIDLLMLEGYQNGPQVETRNGWEMDAVEIKCKTVAAAKPGTYVGIMRGNGQ